MAFEPWAAPQQDLPGFELGAGRALTPPAHAPPRGVCACACSTRAGFSVGDSQQPPHLESGAPKSVNCIIVSSRRRESVPGPQSGSGAGLRTCCVGLADLFKLVYCSCGTVEGKRPLGFYHSNSISSCHSTDASTGIIIVVLMDVRGASLCVSGPGPEGRKCCLKESHTGTLCWQVPSAPGSGHKSLFHISQPSLTTACCFKGGADWL